MKRRIWTRRLRTPRAQEKRRSPRRPLLRPRSDLCIHGRKDEFTMVHITSGSRNCTWLRLYKSRYYYQAHML